MKKSIGNIIIALLLVASLALSFGTGCALGGRISPGPSQGLDVIEQAWSIIFHDYVDKDRLSTSRLSQAAIEGMVEVLDDPYTSYLNTEDYQLSSTSLEGEFGGIGAHVTVEDGQITIIAPIADSPAEKAGIRADTATFTYGVLVISAIINAAAPMIGGAICPPVEATASTAPAKLGL